MNFFETQQAKASSYDGGIKNTEGVVGGGGWSVSEIISWNVQSQASATLATPTETLPFWLTLAEKQSIEGDIHAKKPIWVGESMSAYQKFLNSVFHKEVSVSPYLESHTDAQQIITALKQLFPDKNQSLRLANREEAQASLSANNHLTGYRDAGSGEIEFAGFVGYAWIDDGMRFEDAPFVWRNLSDNSDHDWFNPLYGLSVIPVFG